MALNRNFLLTDCGCVAAGTVGGSIECNVETGLCNCKLNVMNSQCNECKDEFYGLATENTAGNFANYRIVKHDMKMRKIRTNRTFVDFWKWEVKGLQF